MNHKWYKNPAKNWTDTSLVSSNDSIFLRKSVMFLDHRLRSFECLFKCLAFGFTCQPLISMKKLTYQQVWILRRYLYMFTICKYIYLLYLTKEWFILLYHIFTYFCSKKQRILLPENEKHHGNTQKTLAYWYLWPSFQPLEARLRIPTRFLTHLTNLGTAHHIWSWFLRTSKSMGFCFLIHWPREFFLGERIPMGWIFGLAKTTMIWVFPKIMDGL